MAQEFLDLQTFYEDLEKIQVELDSLVPRTVDAVKKSADRHKAILEEYAKRSHAWKNRTGRAEQTLNTFLDDGTITENPIVENGVYIVLSHGAVEPRNGKKYGFFLETMQGGRFAILEPTIMTAGQQVINNILYDLGL